MAETKDLTFKIYRYNPEVDEKPYYDSFKVTLERGTTILRAMNHIKDNLDSKISYRFYCQAGICGSCAIRVNGVSKLACTTQVFDEIKSCKEPDVIIIEPMSNFDIKRDMVVDYNPVVEKLTKYKCWVEPEDAPEGFGNKEFLVAEEDFKVIDPATDCILCGVCYSECSMVTAGRDYVSPLVLLKSYRMTKDTRDSAGQERMNILNQDHGMWDCTHCYRCVESCVKHIPIMDAIQGVRNEAFTRNMKNTEGYRHAKAFYDDIQSKGRLDELKVLIKTKGIFGMVGMMPMGIKMGLKGRTPPVFMKAIPGIEKVRNLFRKIKAK